MLPVAPPGYGESPYAAMSAFAGSPMLISPEGLVREGWLDERSLAAREPLQDDRVDFAAASRHRLGILKRAFEGWRARGEGRAAYEAYCESHRAWLPDYALFCAIKNAHGGVAWTGWEKSLRRREKRALESARRTLADDVAREQFLQFVFDRQWAELRAYARERGVALIGDIPIFLAHDSADVWQNRELFFLDAEGMPTSVSGCPPDYFSATGQRWGNPLYRWARLEKTGYAWWIARFEAMLRRFDVIRLDHFIGFQRYWRIPASAPTAREGKWIKGPGAPFFEAVKAALGDLPLIAEDLGAVTPKVFALRDRFRLPGLKILQFAFGLDPSAPSFRPHNFPRRAVVYTGTHDNDTTLGWFHAQDPTSSTRTFEQAQAERQATLQYLGTTGDEIHWDMIRLALGSVANTAIVPLQDVLGLGTQARMNLPGKASGNWGFRFLPGALTRAHAERLGALTRTYGRAP